MLASLTALMVLASGTKFIGRPAPAFELHDLNGNEVTNATLMGAPYVLFSFCSCDYCKRMGEAWAKVQKKQTMRTVVSYYGKPAEAESYAKRVGLDPAQTILLDDPKHVIIERYQGMPCPTMFSVDAKGNVAFASKEMLGEDENDPTIFIPLALNRLANAAYQATIDEKAGVVLPKMKAVAKSSETSEEDGELFGLDRVKFRNETWILSRDFRFKNTSKDTLHLNKVVSSCGCAGSDIVYKGKKVESVDLKPGQMVDIRINAKITPGDHAEKLVQAWLYDDRSSNSVATARWQISQY